MTDSKTSDEAANTEAENTVDASQAGAPGQDHGHVHGDHCDHDHSHFGHGEPSAPFQRVAPKVGRNDPCACGSGKKFKKCCLRSRQG